VPEEKRKVTGDRLQGTGKKKNVTADKVQNTETTKQETGTGNGL
jgi:hypothetical protein